jgi:uncharacterized protein YabE (DUF348 family)
VTLAQALRPSRFGGRPVAAPRHIARADLSDHPRRFRGRHHAATIFVLLLLAVFGFRMFPEKDVTVLNNGQAYRISATFDAQAEGLAAADVALNPGDRVLFAPGDRHSSVAVQRARDVAIEVDGREVGVRTQATTVGGALADAGLELHPGDALEVEGRSTTERAPLLGLVAASRPVGIGLSAPAGGVNSSIRVSVKRAVPATVMVDNMRVETSSSAPTVALLLEDLGMTVREGDLVRPSLTTPVTAGMTVKLAKARTITVTLDGKEQSLYTQAQTVGDVVRILGLELGPADTISLPANTDIQNGMSLTIARTFSQDEDVKESVPPTTTYETDATLAAGDVRVVPGVDGVRVTKYSVTYKNGVAQDPRVLLGSDVTQSPIPTRHIEGTKPAPAAHPTLNAPGYSGSYKAKASAHVTWYNASQGAWSRDDPSYGHTYTGAIVDYGICAVDPAVIPLGTHIYIPGYGNCLAADTGSLVKGWSVDLGFPESAGNSPWATQTLDIYIID